jgi:subfamily B ATP-binding cassette protein MsbA
MRQFFQILRFGKPYRRHAVLNGVFNLLATVFHLCSMLLLVPFLQLLVNKHREAEAVVISPTAPAFAFDKSALKAFYEWQLQHFIAVQGELGALAWVCVAIVVLFLLKNLFRYLAVMSICIFRNRIIHDLRSRIYDKMLELPLRYHSGERKGDLLSVITNDMQVLEYSVMYSIEMVFREPLAVILFIATMIGFSAKLTLISLILLPLSGLIIARISKSLRKRGTRVQEKSADLLARVEETLGGIRVVKAFNGEADMRRRFERENEMLTRASIALLRRQDVASPLSETMGAAVMAVMAYIGGSLVLGTTPELDGSAFIAYIAIFSQLLTPIKGFSQGWSGIVRGSASAQRVFDLLAVENTVKEKPEARTVQQLVDRVEFRNVSFAYDDREVLKNIDLSIAKGHSVALVGPSGGGKSTMAGLLPRFFDVIGGSITIDGVDVRDLRIADLRGLMGIVTQDSILFNDTIANNIAFGKPGTSEADIRRAATIANAHGFIEQLENGYQTNIGDGGNRLSGGQKQRIAIARAVLKNPDILILDEATSALDTESERLVQDALFNLMKDRTSLVIAHRLSTIQHCDEICVLQAGVIVERGTHTQLFSAGGVYRKLCDMQAFDQ